jgi:hypothetical protein
MYAGRAVTHSEVHMITSSKDAGSIADYESNYLPTLGLKITY